MELITLEPQITQTRRNEVHGMYVLFRKGVTAHETRHFSYNETIVNVDVDRDNTPIGLEVVRYHPPAAIKKINASNIPKEKMMVALFAMTSLFAGLLKLHQEKCLLNDGNQILREMLSSLCILPSDDAAPQMA